MWDVNGHAGEQQITDFMKSNNSAMSLRKRQATSLGMVTTINRQVVENFYSIQ
jgi:hypothetical protein